MSGQHPSLFDDDPADASADGVLVVRPHTRPKGKKEQAVSRLLTKVQSLRQRVEQKRHSLDEALVFHAAHVAPREQRLTELRTDVVRALRPFVGDARLKPADRRILRTILTSQVDEILAHDAAPEQDIRDLFAALHGVDLAEVVEEELEQARSEMEAFFSEIGLDMDVPEWRADMTEEEMAAAAAQMAHGLREAAEAGAGSQPDHRRSKRERREDERRRQFERLRKVNLSAVYRRLAKALHPDLERDPVLREQKSTVMQEVTTAYASNDLHALLRLELEWLDGDPTGAGQRADETLDAYIQLLKEQEAELQTEYATLPLQPRYQALTAHDGPFGLPTLVDGPSEVRELDVAIEGLRAAVERMAAGKAWQEVRGLIQEYRAAKGSRRGR